MCNVRGLTFHSRQGRSDRGGVGGDLINEKLGLVNPVKNLRNQ